MSMIIHYPIYVIASRDGVVVVNTNGQECILLFHARELAERQIAMIQTSHPGLGVLHALPVPDAQALREGLRSLPENVNCAVWDPQGTPMGFTHVGVDELMLRASQGGAATG